LSAPLDTGGFAIDESEGSAVASAATTDIWATDGNTLHLTGSVTITGFAAAPRAGAWRKLIVDAAPLFTDGANLIVEGNTNFQAAAGDIAFVYAETTTQFRVFFIKADGTAVVGGLTQATQAALEAETNENTYAPPDLIKHSPGVAKVMVKFDVTGAIQGTSYNVASVDDDGTGDFGVNLTTAFSAADFPAVVTPLSTVTHFANIDAQTTTAIECRVYTDTGVAQDPTASTMVIALGDQ